MTTPLKILLDQIKTEKRELKEKIIGEMMKNDLKLVEKFLFLKKQREFLDILGLQDLRDLHEHLRAQSLQKGN